MANMAVSRIKREFKEVIKSEEVSKYVCLKCTSSKYVIKYVINTPYCSLSQFDGKDNIQYSWAVVRHKKPSSTIRRKKTKITKICNTAHSARLSSKACALCIIQYIRFDRIRFGSWLLPCSLSKSWAIASVNIVSNWKIEGRYRFFLSICFR